MARTVAVTTEDGYIRVGDVFIKNTSRQTVEDIVFDGTFAAKLGEDAPQVLILHTHGSEAYTMPEGQEYVSTGSFRTADASVSVMRGGAAAPPPPASGSPASPPSCCPSPGLPGRSWGPPG